MLEASAEIPLRWAGLLAALGALVTLVAGGVLPAGRFSLTKR